LNQLIARQDLDGCMNLADRIRPAAAVALRASRREIMAQLRHSMCELYRTLEVPGATPSAPPTLCPKLSESEHSSFITSHCVRVADNS
jgi:hypothetical protein